MKVTHKFQVAAHCPVKPVVDFYECEFVTNRLIPVEEILELTNPYADKTMFQEELCQELANRLKGQITLKGLHSEVHTEVTCEPKRKAKR